MKYIIIIFTLSIAMLTGCTSSLKESTDNTSIATEKTPEQKSDAKDNKNNAEILALLERTEITISGIYETRDRKTLNLVRGNDWDKTDFTGKLKDISDIHTVNENGKILVSLIANVEGQLFKTVSPCGIQCTIEKNSDNKLSIVSINLLEDMLPDITPTVPFDVYYAFEPESDNKREFTSVRFSVTGNEYEANKELYTIEGAEVRYDAATNGRDAGGTYYITIPFNREYIKELEIEYTASSSNSAIYIKFPYLTATLNNGLKIFGRPEISYVSSLDSHPLEKPADYWIFRNLDDNTWGLDSKRKK